MIRHLIPVSIRKDIIHTETFIEPKELVEYSSYQVQREKSLRNLRDDMIDAPIIELINGFNALSYCFTIQSCYGHFVYDDQNDPHNIDSLPPTDTLTNITYRIAYLCFCIDKSSCGKELLDQLKKIPEIDPGNVQFGCAGWFWRRQVNSYVLQVEPEKFKYQDTATLDYKEARHIEMIRNVFFSRLEEVLKIS